MFQYLLFFSQPIGVGYSYGTMVNNSRAAAVDVYDFLQKFYRIYPHLVKWVPMLMKHFQQSVYFVLLLTCLTRNKFIITSGSYGGTYVPHIATVIHEHNQALTSGKGEPGSVHINLESLIISNPFSVGIGFMTTNEYINSRPPPLAPGICNINTIYHLDQSYVGSKFPLPLVAPPRLLQHSPLQQHHLRLILRAPTHVHGAHPVRVSVAECRE